MVAGEGSKVVSDVLKIKQIGGYWDQREVVKPGSGCWRLTNLVIEEIDRRSWTDGID
jgi:hypothetical protein